MCSEELCWKCWSCGSSNDGSLQICEQRKIKPSEYVSVTNQSTDGLQLSLPDQTALVRCFYTKCLLIFVFYSARTLIFPFILFHWNHWAIIKWSNTNILDILDKYLYTGRNCKACSFIKGYNLHSFVDNIYFFTVYHLHINACKWLQVSCLHICEI